MINLLRKIKNKYIYYIEYNNYDFENNKNEINNLCKNNNCELYIINNVLNNNKLLKITTKNKNSITKIISILKTHIEINNEMKSA